MTARNVLDGVVAVITVFCIVAVFVGGGALERERRVTRPRSIQCAWSQAVLVADTLCVRADSAWRVAP